MRKLANPPLSLAATLQSPLFLLHCTLLRALHGLLAIQGNDGHFYLVGPARLHIYTIGDNPSARSKEPLEHQTFVQNGGKTIFYKRLFRESQKENQPFCRGRRSPHKWRETHKGSMSVLIESSNLGRTVYL